MKNLRLLKVLLFTLCLGFSQLGFGQFIQDVECSNGPTLELTDLGWYVYLDDINPNFQTFNLPARATFDFVLPEDYQSIKFDFRVTNSSFQSLDFEGYDYSNLGYEALPDDNWFHYCSETNYHPSHLPFVLPLGGTGIVIGVGGDDPDGYQPCYAEYVDIVQSSTYCGQGYNLEVRNVIYNNRQRICPTSADDGSQCAQNNQATFELSTNCPAIIPEGDCPRDGEEVDDKDDESGRRLAHLNDQFEVLFESDTKKMKLISLTDTNENSTLNISSINGTQILSKDLISRNDIIDLSHLDAGIYFAIINTGSKVQHSKILVK